MRDVCASSRTAYRNDERLTAIMEPLLDETPSLLPLKPFSPPSPSTSTCRHAGGPEDVSELSDWPE
jgi:hypothetical protein